MVDNHHTSKYWENKDYEALQKAQDFKDLYKIAHRIFARMPEGIGQVCGPIATGGLGSVAANLEKFDETVRTLQAEGKVLFDQMPFEWPMQEIKKKVTDGANTILQDFYLPLFESGKIKTLYFIKGWETSYGANWEHDQAKRLGIDIVYLN
jgi:hypothetical protein